MNVRVFVDLHLLGLSFDPPISCFYTFYFSIMLAEATLAPPLPGTEESSLLPLCPLASERRQRFQTARGSAWACEHSALQRCLLSAVFWWRGLRAWSGRSLTQALLCLVIRCRGLGSQRDAAALRIKVTRAASQRRVREVGFQLLKETHTHTNTHKGDSRRTLRKRQRLCV